MANLVGECHHVAGGVVARELQVGKEPKVFPSRCWRGELQISSVLVSNCDICADWGLTLVNKQLGKPKDP